MQALVVKTERLINELDFGPEGDQAVSITDLFKNSAVN